MKKENVYNNNDNDGLLINNTRSEYYLTNLKNIYDLKLKIGIFTFRI